jgi:hypothetical protein
MTVRPSARTWQIVPAAPADEPAVVQLYQRAIGRPVTAAHWHWKLHTLPSPVPAVWLAIHDGLPICHYAAIPTRMLLPDGERMAMVSVNAMTDPAFRRRGVLSDVVRRAHEAWTDAGIPFTLGLPNEQWGTREQALGWQFLFQLDWFTCPLRPETVLAHRAGFAFLSRARLLTKLWRRVRDRRTPRDRTVTVRALQHASPDLDRLWQTARGSLRYAVVRDSARVAWRFLQEPEHACRLLLAERAGEPVGYCAFRVHDNKGRRTATMPDIFVQPGDARGAASLIHAALDTLLSEDVESVSTLALPGSSLANWLGAAGFLRRRHPFRVTIALLAAETPLHVLRDPAQWFITGSDFDVI